MLPASETRVARRLVDLINRLRPLVCGLLACKRPTLPAVPALVLDDLPRLVLPILAPVLGHHRLAQRTVVAHEAHLKDVSQADKCSVIAVDVYPLCAPGLIRAVARGVRAEGHDLEKIERHAIVARHRQDRAAIALEGRYAGFVK